MKFLRISAFVMIALLGASGEVAAMASNHHRNNGGGGGTAHTDLLIGPEAPGPQPTQVPEPGTLILTGLGIGTVAALWRKARRHVMQKERDRKPRP